MDTFEVLNNLLVKLFNDILDVEEKAIITDEFKDISVTDMILKPSEQKNHVQ